jgi:hypothetical protein
MCHENVTVRFQLPLRENQREGQSLKRLSEYACAWCPSIKLAVVSLASVRAAPCMRASSAVQIVIHVDSYVIAGGFGVWNRGGSLLRALSQQEYHSVCGQVRAIA